MSRNDSCITPVARPLRRHILAPIERSIGVVESERSEVMAEIEAFHAFADRVAGMETTTAQNGTGPTRSLHEPDTTASHERLRTAYRETVMSVDHFERVYGESLAENVAAELSPEVAAGFQRSGVAFTDIYKQMLFGTVQDAVQGRQRLVSALDDELDSLDTARSRLAAVLDGASAASRPPGPDAISRFETVAEDRQEMLASRRSLPQLDGHEFCEYAYGDERWTYPVLTAVARARENVIG